ncbi:MAG: hypothetical protein KJZ96_08325 [Rhodocyclaceae bacterium]|jgi:hypothetical protein|nr:hypothetical protein [Rhodocyclaceae bacterium]
MTPSAGHALGYDAAPALSAPLRFFVTAPLFGVVAGLMLLVHPELLESRWTPGALALTHLVTVGFMLMVMVGALFQILPVVAGAVLPATRVLATIVHGLLGSGAIALVWGLAAMQPVALTAAVWLLGSGFATFVAAAAYALVRAPVPQATPRDLRLALIALTIAILLGLTLAMILTGELALPLFPLLKLHVGWAWLGGVGTLLAATSWVVVPMFQITPPYPQVLTRFWAMSAVGLLVLWSAAVLGGFPLLESALAVALALVAGVFIVTTLHLQRRSRRSTPDTTFRAFQLGMGSLIGGILCVLAAHHLDHAAWAVLAGVLILHGGFVSIMLGMLYKIVPFLAWLHLTQDKIKAPNMKKLQPDQPVRRQFHTHVGAFVLLIAAALAATNGLTMFGRLAGLIVMVEFGWLAWNILKVLRAYQRARST